MKREIELCDRSIGYTLKTSARAKKLRLAIYCDGSFVVTKPCGLDEKKLEKVIIQKANWIISKLDYFKQFKGSLSKNNHETYLKHKENALSFVNKKIECFNKIYKFKFNRINIKNQKTRWGSCSRRGSLNFNYRILLLPERIADYIIVHELCHLKEFNHSRNFWSLVAKEIPNYFEIRKELKIKGLFLR